MYFTDAGIEELDDRRGDEQVSVSWLAERLRDFVDLNPEFETAVDRLASWLARLDADQSEEDSGRQGNNYEIIRTRACLRLRVVRPVMTVVDLRDHIPWTRYILTLPRHDISWSVPHAVDGCARPGGPR